MKALLQIIIVLSILSCQGLENNCIDEYDNEMINSVDEELIFAKDLLLENIDSLRIWNKIGEKLEGQDAGILANINLGLWNLIDGAYLGSIKVVDENLMFFEFFINSCNWDEEYIIYQRDNRRIDSFFRDSKIKLDSIDSNWQLLRVKNDLKKN